MDYEKFKNLLAIRINERTTDDINTLDIEFAKCCNNSEIFYEICKNAELKKYEIDVEIMNSIKNIDENYFIIEGEVNYYEVVVEDEIKKSIFLKTIKKGEEFGSYEISLVNEKLEADLKKTFMAVANCECEIAVFKDINKKHELKSMISKKIQKNKKRKSSKAKSANINYNQINEEVKSLKSKELSNINSLIHSESDINIQINKDKEIINSKFVKNKNKEVINNNKIESEKDLNKISSTGSQEEFITFDPEIFIIEDKNVINEIIAKVKQRYEKEFDVFNESFAYEKILSEFDVKEIIEFIEEQFKATKTEFTEMMRSVDTKFINYSENSKKEIKYALLFKRILAEINEMKKTFNEKTEILKQKYYTADNFKNKNLLKLSVEEEIKSPDFKAFIVEMINREGKLNTLLEEKANNDKAIDAKASQIKNDDALLLEKYYCVLCHKLPRNILIQNCNHLVMCDACIKTIKICPRCGLDIASYDKVFR